MSSKVKLQSIKNMVESFCYMTTNYRKDLLTIDNIIYQEGHTKSTNVPKYFIVPISIIWFLVSFLVGLQSCMCFTKPLATFTAVAFLHEIKNNHKCITSAYWRHVISSHLTSYLSSHNIDPGNKLESRETGKLPGLSIRPWQGSAINYYSGQKIQLHPLPPFPAVDPEWYEW